MEQSVSVFFCFFFVTSIQAEREKEKGKRVTVSTSIDHTRSSSVQGVWGWKSTDFYQPRVGESEQGGGECCSTGAGVELMEVVLGGFVGVDRLVQVLLAEADR